MFVGNKELENTIANKNIENRFANHVFKQKTVTLPQIFNLN